VRIRLVNVESSSYRVAREYMIRLDRQDLEDPDKLRPGPAKSRYAPDSRTKVPRSPGGQRHRRPVSLCRTRKCR